MSYQLQQLPIFQALEDVETVLLAGAGGGFDFYCAVPIYLSLAAQGKRLILANLSFTLLSSTTASQVFPYCYEINSNDKDLSGRNYFPEQYLKLWLGMQGHQVPVYAFDRVGAQPLRDAYKYLIKIHDVDAIVLVDGGTDSLMFGDEEGLGTPQEDVCSMAAVYRTGIKKQFLLSIGFGVDHYHGVSHYRFLENVAELMRDGGYLGVFTLLPEMEETQKYIECVEFANARVQGMESIVSNSIVSAIEGQYGNYHKTSRTRGSELWINPLMSMYWCFDLKKVIQKLQYYDLIKDTQTMGEFNGRLARYRVAMKESRKKKQIPI
ncbi:MAG: DUF1152 domain-containing protein [Bacteroidota bacterium]